MRGDSDMGQGKNIITVQQRILHYFKMQDIDHLNSTKKGFNQVVLKSHL
jgi:hypothetical protein